MGFVDRKRFRAAVAGLTPGAPAVPSLAGATRVAPSGATPIPSLAGATRIEPSAALPQQLGSYRVLGLLGTGGMGTVVRARHVEEGWAQQQGGDVAIKLIHPQIATDPEFRSRFMSEAALGRKVQHPGFVPTFDVISEGAWLGTVMSFVTGEPLGSKVVPGGLSVDAVIALLSPIGEALDYLHGLGIVHRDLKPANIVVQPNGRPVVLDLGIAKDMQSGGNHTRTMTTMGTSAWMAPEQADAKHVDGAADRYAFGMIAYVLLAGQMPWPEGASEARVFSNKLMGQLVPLAQVCAGVPEHVAAAVMKMVSVEAGERYLTCVAFVEALRVDEGAARAAEAAAKLQAEVEAAAVLKAKQVAEGAAVLKAKQEAEAAAALKAKQEVEAASKLRAKQDAEVATAAKLKAEAETAARVKAEAETAAAKAALAAMLAREAVARGRAEPAVSQEPESLAQDTTLNAPSGRHRPLFVATGLAVIVGLGVWAWIPNDEKEFAKLCDAPARSGVTVPFAKENEQIISRWVEKNVRGDAGEIYSNVVNADPHQQVSLLVAAAEEHGVVIELRTCPILRELGRTWDMPDPNDLELIGGKSVLQYTELLVTADPAPLFAWVGGNSEVGTLAKNSRANLLGKRGDWYHLSAAGVEGYAHLTDVIPASFFADPAAELKFKPLYYPDQFVTVVNSSWSLVHENGNTSITNFIFMVGNDSQFGMTDLKLKASIKDKDGKVLEEKEFIVEGAIKPRSSTMIGSLKADKKDKTAVDRVMTEALFTEMMATDRKLVDRWVEGVDIKLESEGFDGATISVAEVRAVPPDAMLPVR